MIVAEVEIEGENGEYMRARDTIYIVVVDIPLISYIIGGDRSVYWGDSFEIGARIWDPNTIYAYNEDPNIITNWTCID